MESSSPLRWPAAYPPSLIGTEAAAWGLDFLKTPATFLIAQWAVCQYPKTDPTWWWIFAIDLARYEELTGKEVLVKAPDSTIEMSFYTSGPATTDLPAPTLVGGPSLVFHITGSRADALHLAAHCAGRMVHQLQPPTPCNGPWWGKVIGQASAYYRRLH